MKQIASLTVTRTRCSTFGHGPGLRRQERRPAVGLGAAEKLLEHSRLPLAWHDQRTVLGFA
ncbi:MAG TPA: hypothetical protein VJX94_11345 [Stellaceae bacterium]|nr:hypothetical protein [Stellaceae bacterium]